MTAYHSKSQQAAADRLSHYLSFDFDRDGGGGPIDPRCIVCSGNADDVNHQSRADFRQLHSARASYLVPQVWVSHFFPLEGYRFGTRCDEKITLPDWVTQDTPYFSYTRSEPPTQSSQTPIIMRAFVRSCKLCGARDPFGYIERHLSVDFTEQDRPHDLSEILIAEPPKVTFPPSCRLEIDDGKATAKHQLNLLTERLAMQSPSDDGKIEHPSSPRPSNIDCDDTTCPARVDHKFCIKCGRKL